MLCKHGFVGSSPTASTRNMTSLKNTSQSTCIYQRFMIDSPHRTTKFVKKGFEMNTTQLAHTVAGNTGYTSKMTKEVVFDTFKVMARALAGGQDIRIPGFGSIRIVQRKGRIGRNPRTGEEVKIPDHKAVKFFPAKELHDEVHSL